MKEEIRLDEHGINWQSAIVEADLVVYGTLTGGPSVIGRQFVPWSGKDVSIAILDYGVKVKAVAKGDAVGPIVTFRYGECESGAYLSGKLDVVVPLRWDGRRYRTLIDGKEPFTRMRGTLPASASAECANRSADPRNRLACLFLAATTDPGDWPSNTNAATDSAAMIGELETLSLLRQRCSLGPPHRALACLEMANFPGQCNCLNDASIASDFPAERLPLVIERRRQCLDRDALILERINSGLGGTLTKYHSLELLRLHPDARVQRWADQVSKGSRRK